MDRFSRPHYGLAEELAEELLFEYDIKKLPVDLDFMYEFDDLTVMTFTEFATKSNKPFNEVVKIAEGGEGCCIFNPLTSQYYILYNDRKPFNRQRWTLAHEIGHYMLKHNEITGENVFSRSQLSLKKYLIFEKEANCFARALLAPAPVLNALSQRKGPLDPRALIRICKLSWDAAKNCLSFVNNGIKNGIKFTRNDPLVEHFYDFIIRSDRKYTCINCITESFHGNSNFCSICGPKGIKNIAIMEDWSLLMRYSSIPTSENSIATECPRCGNENVHGPYCHTCGTYIVNVCTGLDIGELQEEIEEGDYGRRGPIWHQWERGCGTLLTGEARFCHECGSTSTFYENDLLLDWETEKQQAEDPFGQVAVTREPIDIDDSDLPF
jgi:Zn-dependent peptidase ImmA (M78 family)